jgi:hypothetical protein
MMINRKILYRELVLLLHLTLLEKKQLKLGKIISYCIHLLDKVVILKLGSFGEVRKAIHIASKAVRAVKIIHKNKSSVHQ